MPTGHYGDANVLCPVLTLRSNKATLIAAEPHIMIQQSHPYCCWTPHYDPTKPLLLLLNPTLWSNKATPVPAGPHIMIQHHHSCCWNPHYDPTKPLLLLLEPTLWSNKDTPIATESPPPNCPMPPYNTPTPLTTCCFPQYLSILLSLVACSKTQITQIPRLFSKYVIIKRIFVLISFFCYK